MLKLRVTSVGGPGTGKTTALDIIKAALELKFQILESKQFHEPEWQTEVLELDLEPKR